MSAVLLAGCSASSNPLEEALQQAGENRRQLEAVLSHFHNDPDKLKAAEFIISNMPYATSYSENSRDMERYYECYRIFSKFGSRGLTKVDSVKKSGRIPSFDPNSLTKDITTVDSSFLIKAVDDAFRLKETMPWCADIPDSLFYNYILPYRVKDEELSQWRDSVALYARPVIDSLVNAGCRNPLDAANALLSFWSGQGFKMTNLLPQGPSLGFRNIINRAGSCREFAHGAVYLMRAAGIPSGVDLVTAQGERNSTHMWAFVLDGNGKTYYANLGETSWTPAEEFDIRTPKIYREEFGQPRQNPLLPSCRDVTDIYKPRRSFTLKFDSFKGAKSPYVLLFPRHTSWMPVDVSVNSRYPEFRNVGGDVIGCLGVMENGEAKPVSAPFMIDAESGAIRFLEAKDSVAELVAFAKYPVDPSTGDLGGRLIGGVIEGSDSPLFTRRDTIFQITEYPMRLLNYVDLPDNLPAYRYYRYYGPEQGFCNIAELSLFEHRDDKTPLKGRVFGTPGSWLNDTTKTFRSVFDGDVYTSFDHIEPQGGWAAIDCGKPVKLSRLMYAPRHRDNYIRKGDDFEIYYFDNLKWNLAARMKAEADSLSCKVPVGALYYVRNLTRGNDERPFDYDFNSRSQNFR